MREICPAHFPMTHAEAVLEVIGGPAENPPTRATLEDTPWVTTRVARECYL